MRVKWFHIPLLLAVILPAVSCSKDEEYDLLDMSPIVTVIYPAAGLGDRSYVDKIYLGAERASIEDGVRVQHLMPYSLEETQAYLTQALEYRPDDGVRRLYIVAEVGLEGQMAEFARKAPDDEMFQYLFLETRQTLPVIHTLNLPLYGVCYEAGVLSASMEEVSRAAIVNANPNTPALDAATEGFRDGFGAEKVEMFYLSDGYIGYDMAWELYRQAYSLDLDFQLVLPLCGGSAQGLFRYNREYPDSSFYTVGLDADMSGYSPRVPFSCVKHIDRAVQESIRMWLDGNLPAHQSLGLEQGYTELVITPEFAARLAPAYESVHQAAIEKEIAYEKGR